VIDRNCEICGKQAWVGQQDEASGEFHPPYYCLDHAGGSLRVGRCSACSRFIEGGESGAWWHIGPSCGDLEAKADWQPLAEPPSLAGPLLDLGPVPEGQP
jgi:hypothetical protein